MNHRRRANSGGDRDGGASALYGLLTAVVRQVPREVSLTAVATLSTLERTGPRRITELAVTQGVTQPSMTALVNGLERGGLVRRLPDPTDRRVTRVEVTEDGAGYLRQRRRSGTEVLSQLITKLSAEEAAALAAAVPALLRLRQLDDEQRDPVPPAPQ